MNTKVLTVLSALVLTAVVVVSGCGSPAAPAKQAGNSGKPTPTLAESYFLKEAPADAKSISAVKKEAKEGDEVVIRARVGGRKDDTFTHGRAMMYVMDMGLNSCDMNVGDTCETPWDYCCEDPKTIAQNIATIQFVDADGKILKSDLKGSNGLDTLSVVTIKGKVGKRDDPNVLVVSASGIYVEKPDPKRTN
jgi:hypothetical protein